MDQIVLDFLKLIHRKEINKRTYFTFGYQAEYKQNENIDLGYIPFILCNRFTNQVEIISKLNPNNRCGIERNSTEFITVHDTASAAPTANALAHSNWLNSMANDINSKTSVSWHFTVDENGIIQHLPDNEIGYHAGDGTKVKLTYEDTKIKVTTENPNVTISNDGYFEINSIKTNILAPKNNPLENVKKCQLPYQGINVKIGRSDTYLIGSTYYNDTYKVIANRGGNLNSIGIETCVNLNSDYIRTMRITADLVARLLIKYNLDITAVKQHNFFSGKDCPMTIRHANMWEEFLSLVKINFIYYKQLSDYEIQFESLDKVYLDDDGKVIKYQENYIIKYKVIVSKDGIKSEYVFESNLV